MKIYDIVSKIIYEEEGAVLKIAIECKSPLMQKSMEMFLQNHLSSYRQCDIVVRDEPCLNDEKCFYVSTNKEADLVKPFSKAQLILALEARYKTIKKEDISDEETSLDIEVLEKRIKYLTQQYQENILKAVRVFYEK